VAEQEGGGPVADFCAGLRRLQQDWGLGRPALARRLGYSRAQLYAILDGRISRPPEWGRLVEPLVRVCTDNDEGAVAEWRRQHDVLVGVYHALRNQHRQHGTRRSTGVARVVPAQLPTDVDVSPVGRTSWPNSTTV
jgi:helix-turn-helix protein